MMQKKPVCQALYDPISAERLTAMQKVIGSKSTKHTRVIAVSVIGIAVLVGLLIATSIEASTTEKYIIFGNVAVTVIFVSVIGWLYQTYVTKKKAMRQIRFDDFANDNGLTYIDRVDDPVHQGVVFNTGDDRRIEDVLLSKGDSEFEVGNYTYVVRRSKSSTICTYGVIRIKLPRHVAHMLLDGKSNNTNIFGVSLSNLPVAMKSDQTLRLEGDFNDHFTLYAPIEYERDALYVFTPDLMALLIDTVAQYDAEVIDDQLFIYGKKFDLLDAGTWGKIYAIISTVGAKTISQTDYYADERVGDRSVDMVAQQGRRLRKGIAWQVIVVAVIYAVYTIFQLLADQ